jgi:hypothetical protein
VAASASLFAQQGELRPPGTVTGPPVDAVSEMSSTPAINPRVKTDTT